MMRLLSQWLAVFVLIALPQTLVAEGLMLEENFTGELQTLKNDNWSLPDTTRLTADSELGRQVLRIDVDGAQDFNNRYAHKFIEVEPGKIYSGQVWVRTENVQAVPGRTRNRGAVIFLQFLDEDFKHVSGGSFPSGPMGTQGWLVQQIEHTRPIPGNVRYLHVLIGIEGQGTAWFSNLQIREQQNFGLSDYAPANNAIVSSQRPELQWQSADPRDEYLIEISQSENFDDDTTSYFYVTGSGQRPPQTLATGQWYWRVRPKSSELDGFLTASPPQSFIVPDDASTWPPHVSSLSESWQPADQRSFYIKVSPYDPSFDIEVLLAGSPTTIGQVQDDRIEVRLQKPVTPGIHDVHITVRNEQGQAVEGQGFLNNVAPGSRISIDDDRIMRVDGERFFPLGSYRDPTDSLVDFEGVIEAGFNLTHNYEFDHGRASLEEARTYLDLAHQHDIKVFMAIDRNNIRNESWVRDWVANLMDKPALANWYLYDEPEIYGVEAREIQATHDWITQTDPFTPTSIVVLWQHEFERYGTIADIFYRMAYILEADEPLDARHIERRIRVARDLLPDNQPLWAVLQVHTPRYGDYRRSRSTALRELGHPTRPTYEESRCMAYTALASDVEGIVWYWLHNRVYNKRDDSPEVWAGLVKVVQELRELEPYLIARRTEADAFTAPDPIRVWTRQAHGKRVLALVNPLPESADITIDLSIWQPKYLLQRETGEIIEPNNHQLNVSFAPNEVKLFEWHVE